MANNIRNIREAKGLTLERLAEMLDTGPRTIQRFELEERNVSLAWLKRIAKALGCKPGDLVEDTRGGWVGKPGNEDQELFWKIVEIIVDQARAHPKLKKASLVGIAKAIFAAVKDGKMQLGRKSQINRAVETLITYEQAKLN